MSEGWIKLHRKFLKWEWFEDPKMIKMFLYILLNANHEDKRWKGRLILRGQIVTGRLQLAKTLNLSEQEIRTCITRLKSTNEITSESCPQYTVITIVNYDQYQQINQRSNQQATNKQPTSNQRATTTKEVKNIRIKEKQYTKDFIGFWDGTNKKGVKQSAFNAFKNRLKTHSLDDIQKAYCQMKRDKEETEFRYWPDVSAFLNTKFESYLERSQGGLHDTQKNIFRAGQTVQDRIEEKGVEARPYEATRRLRTQLPTNSDGLN